MLAADALDHGAFQHDGGIVGGGIRSLHRAHLGGGGARRVAARAGVTGGQGDGGEQGGGGKQGEVAKFHGGSLLAGFDGVRLATSAEISLNRRLIQA
ncbi:hypothetical protein D9M70_615970 [compost metagenome]